MSFFDRLRTKLFVIFLGVLYDAFWVIGFFQGLWRKYFGEDD